MEEKIFCQNCGSENTGGSKFCLMCGATLPAAPAVVPVPEFEPEKEMTVEDIAPADEVETVPTFEDTMPLYEEAVTQPKEETVPETMFEMPPYPAHPMYEKQYTQPEPAPVQQRRERAEAPAQNKQSRHIGAKIFAALFAVILFVAGLIPTLLYPISNMLDEDNIRDAVEEADIYKVVSDLLDGEDVGDFIVDNVHTKMQGKLNPTEKQVKKLLADDDIKEFLADKLVDFATDIIEDNGDGEITSRDIYEFIRDNRDAISTAVGYTLTSEELSLIEEQLEKDGMKDISIDAVREKYPDEAEYVSFALSDVGLYCSFGVVILFALIIFLICIKCVPVALKTVGIVFLVNGGIALLVKPAFAVVAKILSDVLGPYTSLVNSLGAPLLEGFVTIGLVFVCAGAALIIINIIVSLITKLVNNIKAKRAA